MQEQDTLIGKRFGNYVVEGLLGSGGMGSVYGAVHPTMGKKVAIKVLRRELAHDRVALGRLLDEARAANSIGHENIVQIFDCGESPEGLPYVAMELLVGETLQTALERQGRLAPRRAVRIARQVCAALGAAHRRGIIHRDIKPQNIFLSRATDAEERVKLLDFGVAKLLDAANRATPATATGALVGTPYYMSPEQARGDAADGRSDLWALAVVLYRTLTGELPFEGGSFPEVLTKVLAEPVPPFSEHVPPVEVPSALERAIMRALSKNPSDRPHDMESFDRELAAALPEATVGGVTPPPNADARDPVIAAAKTVIDPSQQQSGTNLAASAVATAERQVSRRMLWVRMALYPTLVGLLLFGYWLLLKSSIVDRKVALELPIVGIGMLPLAYLLELGFYVTERRKLSVRPLHLFLVAMMVFGTTYAVNLNGSITNYMVMFYVLIIAFTRLRLGRGAALFALLLSLGCYLALVAVEQLGVIPYARLLRSIYAPTLPAEHGYAIVVVMGVSAFLVFTYIGSNLLARGLEQREEVLAELTRGLEGRMAEQLDTLRRREKLRHFLPAPLVDSVVRGETEPAAGFVRKKVSLCACTLPDFYTHVGGLEPEDQVRVLNEFFAALASVAQRHGATLESFGESSGLLVLGAPRTVGEREDALRAVRSAQALLRQIEELRPGWRAIGAGKVVAKIGVHSGYAAVGNFGSELRLQYGALGACRSVAELAAQAAPPDGAAITATARALVGDGLAAETCGELTVPGSSERLALFTLRQT